MAAPGPVVDADHDAAARDGPALAPLVQQDGAGGLASTQRAARSSSPRGRRWYHDRSHDRSERDYDDAGRDAHRSGRDDDPGGRETARWGRYDDDDRRRDHRRLHDSDLPATWAHRSRGDEMLGERARVACAVLVSQLPVHAGEREVRAFFGQVGDVEDVCFIKDRSGTSRGMACVEFSALRSASMALMLNGQKFCMEHPACSCSGFPLAIKPAEPPTRNTEPTLHALTTFLRHDIPRRRRFSLGAASGDEVIQVDRMGQHFAFVNRSAECQELLLSLQALEAVRSKSDDDAACSMETRLRITNLPLCTGIPGIGKTRFAREAAFHILHDKPERSSFEDAIVDACLEDRNLRLHCLSIPQHGFSDAPLEHHVSALLILEYCKHRVTDLAAVQTLIGRLRLSIQETIDFIFSQASKPDPAIIINVDEAQAMSSTMLASLLMSLVTLLLTRKLRVFPILTGITASTIRAALNSSSIGEHEICLPLLQHDHMVEISRTLLPRVSFTSRAMRMLAWWTRGVPRYLEYAFQQVASIMRGGNVISRDDLGARVAAMSEADVASTLEAVAAMIFKRVAPNVLPLTSAFGLCVLNVAVPSSHILGVNEAGSHITIHDAQAQSMLYFEHVAGAHDGFVRMPPLTLHWLAKMTTCDPKLLLFSHISPAMTPRDNEFTCVSVLMHRMRALRRLGCSHTKLSALGIPTDNRFIPDEHVQLPTCFAVVETPTTITGENFFEFARSIRTVATRDVNTPIAFLSKPTAAFADAFVLMPDFTIFLQEKQSVVARRARDAGTTVAGVPPSALSREYAKLGDTSSYGRHVLLVIVDARSPLDDRDSIGASRRIVSAPLHAQLLSSMVAELRAMRMHASEADAAAAADSEAV